MSKAKKIRVLRISSLPSTKNPGAGMAASKLIESEFFETTAVTYKLNAGNCYLSSYDAAEGFYELGFPNVAFPKKRSGVGFLLAQLRRAYAILFFSTRLFFASLSVKVDVLHIHSPLHFLATWMPQFWRSKIVVSIHGTDYQRLKDSFFYRALLFRVNLILCVAGSARNELQRLFPRKVVAAVFNGVDSELYKSSVKSFAERDKVIISVGTLRWHKNHALLIEAFSDLVVAAPDWRLVIIGEGPERHKLEQLIASHGIEDKVTLLGILDSASVAKKLGQSRIFAMSSVTEGLPKALLEAMSCGCACVATDVGDCKDVLGGAGIVVPSEDLSSLKDRLEELMATNETGEEFSEKAKHRAEEFTWESYCDRHLSLYNTSLLESQGA